MNLFDHQEPDLKDRIRAILEQNPKTRDNDNLLVSILWREDLQRSGISVYRNNTSEFLTLLSDPKNKGKLTAFASVVRYRSMIQKEDPSLLGKTHRKRTDDASEIAGNFANS